MKIRKLLLGLLVALVMLTLSVAIVSATCGGGFFKLDDWPEAQSGQSELWACSWAKYHTPACQTPIVSASAVFTAGQYEGPPNECYGFEWDQERWTVSELWSTEQEKNDWGCQDISNIVVSYQCKCPTAVKISGQQAQGISTQLWPIAMVGVAGVWFLRRRR